MSLHNVIPNNTNHNLSAYQKHLSLLSLEKNSLWETTDQEQTPTHAEKN